VIANSVNVMKRIMRYVTGQVREALSLDKEIVGKIYPGGMKG